MESARNIAVADVDGALVERLRRGERRAFDDVYGLYCDRIFRFLCRLSGRREVAEDLQQETWVKLARASSSLAADTELAPWLFTVARNTWKDHARGRAREAARIETVTAEPVADHDVAFDQRRRIAKLESVLQTLAEVSREVLLLCAVEGLQPSQAAAILGIKPDAARQRLSRARAELEAALGEKP